MLAILVFYIAAGQEGGSGRTSAAKHGGVTRRARVEYITNQLERARGQTRDVPTGQGRRDEPPCNRLTAGGKQGTELAHERRERPAQTQTQRESAAAAPAWAPGARRAVSGSGADRGLCVPGSRLSA